MLANLVQFRQSAYQLLNFACDSTFELMDAILTTKNLQSFPELSFSPLFRRQWSSVYESIEDCRPNSHKLMKLYLEQMVGETRPIIAGDHTPWARPEAKTLQDRTSQHSPQSKGNTVLGQGYSTLAWIPEPQGSWALPLRHELITSFESPLTKGAFQLRAICSQMRERPISIWDSEYSNIPFLKLTAQIQADKLIRLRPNRCLWTAPPPYSGKGRPRVHGDKFKLSQSETYPPPDIELTIEDEKNGLVYIRRWFNLHFRNGKDYPMDVIAIQKIDSKTGVGNKPMWLACWAEEEIDTVELWRIYQRRFAIEHWNRFAKQRLHWTLPKLSTPQQCQRWSHLMPLMTWQLWLARNTVPDNPLPWQKRQLRSEMTPGRVAQGFASLLAMIGTPAQPPKLRGKSGGWKKGRKRSKKIKFPVVKKRYSVPKKKNKKKK